MPHHPVILNTASVAKLLDMSTEEVTRGAREEWLPAHRDRHARQFDRDEVLEWLRTHPAVAEVNGEIEVRVALGTQ